MPKPKETYDYVRAIIDCGELRWEYQVTGTDMQGRQSHDEDVSEWTDEGIRLLTRMTLDVERGIEIEVLWL